MWTVVVVCHISSAGLSVVRLTHCGWSQCGLWLWCAILLGGAGLSVMGFTQCGPSASLDSGWVRPHHRASAAPSETAVHHHAQTDVSLD